MLRLFYILSILVLLKACQQVGEHSLEHAVVIMPLLIGEMMRIKINIQSVNIQYLPDNKP